MERTKYKNEFDKLPDKPKTLA